MGFFFKGAQDIGLGKTQAGVSKAEINLKDSHFLSSLNYS